VFAGIGVLGVLVMIVLMALAGGGDARRVGDAAAALERAGCTLERVAALDGDHSVTARDGTSSAWNTDPPTSGTHHAEPVIWGAYDDPVNPAQLVHNLEHGGIFILYGPGVTAATVGELRTFYDGHATGTVLAPAPGLGGEIKLGAWTAASANDPAEATAYLATCSSFGEQAFTAFFDAYQFSGPERLPTSALEPGT
jgi:hypothetical protein